MRRPLNFALLTTLIALTSPATLAFAQEVTMPASDTVAAAEPAAAEPSPWKAACELGGSMARGNSHTGMLNTGCDTEWSQDKFKLSLNGDVAFGRAFYGDAVSYYAGTETEVGRIPESKRTTQKNAQLALREDYFVSDDKRSYVFSVQSLAHDKFAGYKRRFAIEGGAGHTYVLTETQNHGLEGGIQYEREKTVLNKKDDRVGFVASILGSTKLNEAALFEYKVSYLPSLTDSDDFRIDGMGGLNVKLSDRVSFKTSLDVLYDHDPNTLPATDAAGNAIPGFEVKAENTDLTWNNLLVVAIF